MLNKNNSEQEQPYVSLDFNELATVWGFVAIIDKLNKQSKGKHWTCGIFYWN